MAALEVLSYYRELADRVTTKADAKGVQTRLALHVQGTKEYSEWYDGLCAAECRGRSEQFEYMLMRWCAAHGYPAPPPRVSVDQANRTIYARKV